LKGDLRRATRRQLVVIPPYKKHRQSLRGRPKDKGLESDPSWVYHRKRSGRRGGRRVRMEDERKGEASVRESVAAETKAPQRAREFDRRRYQRV
jgi:hypothetical protein